MSNRAHEANERTRRYFGGPGIGTLAMFGAFFFVVPGIGKVAGLDVFSIALLLAGLAVCIVAVSRVRKRLIGKRRQSGQHQTAHEHDQDERP